MTAESTQTNFARKLIDLNPSSISIQTLSKWMVFNQKYAPFLVKTWHREANNAKPERKLVFLYLANDVMQQTRKRGKEQKGDFINEWLKVLPGVYVNIYQRCQHLPKTLEEAARLCSIWQERGLYEPQFLDKLQSALKGTYTPPPLPQLDDASAISSATRAPGYSGAGGSAGFVRAEPQAKVPPKIMSIVEVLDRLNDHLQEAEKLTNQVASLPEHYFQPPPESGGVPAELTFENVEEALHILGTEKTVLEDCRKEVQTSLNQMKEILSEQMEQAKSTQKRLETNKERTAMLTQHKERLRAEPDAPHHLHFKAPGGAAPPPLADSDEESENAGPDSKRQKVSEE